MKYGYSLYLVLFCISTNQILAGGLELTSHARASGRLTAICLTNHARHAAVGKF